LTGRAGRLAPSAATSGTAWAATAGAVAGTMGRIKARTAGGARGVTDTQAGIVGTTGFPT